jgi:preprotein translocase subunit SecB
MQPSPLDLVYYHLTEINVTPDKDFDSQESKSLYPDFEDADFSAQVRLAAPVGETDPYEFMLKLQLTGQAKEGRHFPYRFSISTEGVIRYTGDKLIDERKELVAINGAAMLYGALREQLLSITSRFQNGPMMLPTVNFLDLRRPKPTSEPKQTISKKVTGKPARKPRAKKEKPSESNS